MCAAEPKTPMAGGGGPIITMYYYNMNTAALASLASKHMASP